MRARLLATAAAMMLATNAWAFEPTGSPVADAVLSALEQSGTVVTYGSATGDDTSANIKDLLVSVPGFKAPEAYRVGEIAITGASIGADRVSAASFEASGVVLSLGEPDVSLTIARIVGTDLARPAADFGDFLGRFRFEDLRLNGFNLAVSLGDIDYVVTQGDTARSILGTMTATGFTLHGSDLPPEVAPLLTALGYDEISFSANADFSLEKDSGTFEYRRVVYSVKNAADLILQLRISGLTPERVNSLYKQYAAYCKALEAIPAPPAAVDGKVPEISPEDQEKAKAAHAAAEAELQQLKQIVGDLTFQSFSVTIDNKSIVQRLLSLHATQTGTTPEALTEQLIAGVPQMSAAIPDPAFRQQAADAVVAFLRSPGTITWSLAPAEPVPFSLFLGDTPPDPATLATLLGAKITATPAQ